MAGGIYQIGNGANGNRYIGSSMNLRRRWQRHLAALRQRQHANQHLQRAFDKDGEAVFVFSGLELVDDSSRLIPREQHYLDTLNPEYNIAKTAGSTLGCRPSPETRRKLSEAHKGKHLSEEHRRKLSEAQKGERGNNYGKHASAETCARISAAWTPERRQAQGEKRRGKPLGDQHRARISEALKAYWAGVRATRDRKESVHASTL